eukprot:TRINITY_DN19242_c0_g1_i1.p1 TRINITY_DN19242_c0_g1~~TRINITY_DN19242_c0_g1_i1.p1  ORF type:complete len:197 (-),score=48.20 TRINITY_DN19242_c0_g1_i1:139-729(-)
MLQVPVENGSSSHASGFVHGGGGYAYGDALGGATSGGSAAGVGGVASVADGSKDDARRLSLFSSQLQDIEAAIARHSGRVSASPARQPEHDMKDRHVDLAVMKQLEARLTSMLGDKAVERDSLLDLADDYTSPQLEAQVQELARRRAEAEAEAEARERDAAEARAAAVAATPAPKGKTKAKGKRAKSKARGSSRHR